MYVRTWVGVGLLLAMLVLLSDADTREERRHLSREYRRRLRQLRHPDRHQPQAMSTSQGDGPPQDRPTDVHFLGVRQHRVRTHRVRGTVQPTDNTGEQAQINSGPLAFGMLPNQGGRSSSSATAHGQRHRHRHRHRNDTSREAEFPYLDADVLDQAARHAPREDERSGQPSTPMPALSPDQWRWRERKKQARLFMIQTQILSRLGLRRQPNITESDYSRDDIERLKKAFNNTFGWSEPNDRVLYDNEDYYAKRLQAHVPSCDLPPKTHRVWRDGNLFRLYFHVEAPDGFRSKETVVARSTLRLFKKHWTSECDCNDTSAGEPGPGRRHSDRRRVPADGESRRGRTRPPDSDGQDNEPAEQDQFRFTVFKYKKPVKRNKKDKKTILGSVMIDANFVGWIKIDIKTAVEQWFKRSQRNFGVEIQVEDENQQILNPFNVIETYNCTALSNRTMPLPFPIMLPVDNAEDRNDSLVFNATYPSLVVLTMQVPKQRPKSRPKREAISRKSCARDKIYVSFSDFGWNDFIIQPQGFEAGFCRGTCSPVSSNKYFHSMYVQRNKYECCGPSRLKSLSVLHYNDNGKLSLSVLENFVVTDCGCRV